MKITPTVNDDGSVTCRAYWWDPISRRDVRVRHTYRDMGVEEAVAAFEIKTKLMRAPLEHGFASGNRFDTMLLNYIEATEPVHAANTTKTYRSLVKRYIQPSIGHMAVQDVTPATIAGLYSELQRKDGGFHEMRIAENTICQMHAFLRGAFRWLMRNDFVRSNPCVGIDSPHRTKSVASTLTPGQTERLLEALYRTMGADAATRTEARRKCLCLAAWLSLMTGMRLGETCAITRDDVGYGRINVHATVIEVKGRHGGVLQPKPKELASIRKVAIDDETLQVILDHLRWQARWMRERESVANPSAGEVPLVSIDGDFTRPSTISGYFKKLCRDLGLPSGVSFHTLRHTHVSYLLDEGYDAKTIQERLGHADITTTLRTYAHLMPGRDREVAHAMGELARTVRERV